jgi:hypothetical protein
MKRQLMHRRQGGMPGREMRRHEDDEAAQPKSTAKTQDKP